MGIITLIFKSYSSYQIWVSHKKNSYTLNQRAATRPALQFNAQGTRPFLQPSYFATTTRAGRSNRSLIQYPFWNTVIIFPDSTFGTSTMVIAS